MRYFFGFMLKSWKTVYYHFDKWSRDGSWERLWTSRLKVHKDRLDMSSVQLDGSHTRARMGGQAVGYQARKASKTTNMLFLTDRQGIPLAVSDPVAGNHHDLYQIENSFKKICTRLRQAEIEPEGLVLNADAGFDSKNFL